MSVMESCLEEHLSSTFTPYTPLSYSVSDVPSLTSSCSSSASTSPLSIQDHEVNRISRRPRGFLRPSATRFSDSARNRESVMSLGSIAHIQHYFARTGLLDGKGAQIAHDSPKHLRSLNNSKEFDTALRFPRQNTLHDDNNTQLSAVVDAIAEPYEGNNFITLAEMPGNRPLEISALPPTTSTYRHVSTHLPAPPTIGALRKELRNALVDAKSVLEGLSPQTMQDIHEIQDLCSATASQGWHEIEGLHVLDLVTLAIRAAKEFYTCHDRPQRLYNIKSERQIRLELYKVLDVLKRVAGRNFAGGWRQEEINTINNWIHEIEITLDKEETAEQSERNRLKEWTWMSGDWTGRSVRDQEWHFIKSFEFKDEMDPLPVWLDPIDDMADSSSFLHKLRDGKRLIGLHNAIVQSSMQRFGEITNFHHDTEKPYRRSENLKFWIKAAELRWEVRLSVDVSKLVISYDFQTWKEFDTALLQWCKALREQLTNEWSYTFKLRELAPSGTIDEQGSESDETTKITPILVDHPPSPSQSGGKEQDEATLLPSDQ